MHYLSVTITFPPLRADFFLVFSLCCAQQSNFECGFSPPPSFCKTVHQLRSCSCDQWAAQGCHCRRPRLRPGPGPPRTRASRGGASWQPWHAPICKQMLSGNGERASNKASAETNIHTFFSMAKKRTECKAKHVRWSPLIQVFERLILFV